MAWLKSSAALVARFDDILPRDPRVERRKMFGYASAFVNGNMCMGLYQEDLLLRLAEPDRKELISRHGGKTFEPMAGRPMREYVTLPADILDDDEALRGWVARSFRYASTLPVKVKKAAKKK